MNGGHRRYDTGVYLTDARFNSVTVCIKRHVRANAENQLDKAR